MRISVVPAYGRDYKSKKEVQTAWDEGKDFQIQDMSSPDDGRYVNKQDVPAGTVINARYKRLTQIAVITAK